MVMFSIPRERGFDSTLALKRDPYRFIPRRCAAHGADLFRTRIMLRKAICMRGAAAAELFCDPERFTRKSAMPGRIQKSLLGHDGVQTLDGQAHRHRKALHLAVMSPERVAALVHIFARRLRAAGADWEHAEQVILYDALRELLCRSVCEWADVPLDGRDIQTTTDDLTALFDNAGSVGPPHWRARRGRKRSERWIASLVEDIRFGRYHPRPASAALAMAWHQDLRGDLLSPRVAAVELLNVLRPTVATAAFMTFTALAVHEFRHTWPQLQDDRGAYRDLFVQEVRRFYPFFPAVCARTRTRFEWRGYTFPKGVLVLLSLYGTNHDPRLWPNPDEFRPGRFRDHRREDVHGFVPQGVGQLQVDHRCPGGEAAFALMRCALDFLVDEIQYRVPAQDAKVDYSRLPAVPKSGFIIDQVARRQPFPAPSSSDNGAPCPGQPTALNRVPGPPVQEP